MTNVVDINLLNISNWLMGENVSTKIRAWFLASFIITFCGILGSLWIMVNNTKMIHKLLMLFYYLYQLNRFVAKKSQYEVGAQFTGVLIFVSTIIATIGSIMFVLGKTFNSVNEYDEL